MCGVDEALSRKRAVVAPRTCSRERRRTRRDSSERRQLIEFSEKPAMKYEVKFERIGRNHAVEPLTVTVDGEADLCRRIRAHARPHLRSRDFDVCVDLDAGSGFIACGMHSGGNFTVRQV